MDEYLLCKTPDGRTSDVLKSRLIFRPSVYGIIVSDGKLLVTLSRTTGKWKIPGGGISLGESIEATLHRELFEECGIRIHIEKQAFFKEDFFCFDGQDDAWQAHLFFYFVTPLSLEVTNQHNVMGDESDHPQLVEIDLLKSEDFQFAGEEILRTIR